MLPLYMGIGNTIGRLGLGQLLHIRLVHPISTYQIIMVLGGVTALVSTLSSTYTHIVIFSILYMAFDGSIQGLDAVPVSLLSGQTMFEEAFGITLVIQGISRLIGPPALGMFLKSYYDLFYSMQSCNYVGSPRTPALLLQTLKVPFHCSQDLLIIISKLESSEIRKIPVIFLLFLNLKNIIPITLLKIPSCTPVKCVPPSLY